MSQLPSLPRTIADIVEEYETKDAAVDEAIAEFHAAWDRLGMSTTVQGTFVETLGSKPMLHPSSLKSNLLRSGWKAVYNRLQIDRIASAKDKQLFERTIADPPPLTLDNARATFADYFERPRFHILRGLAEVFSDLDPSYKSHSKVKIGVKGLPKRVIMPFFTSYSGHSKNKFSDICNALAAYQGKPAFEYVEMRAIETAHRLGEDAILDGRTYTVPPRYEHQKPDEFKTVDRGMIVRGFANGNAHVIFDKWTCIDINRALAEFYGDVLPDVTDDDPAPSVSTALAKDLQFYWSPPAVVSAALEYADIFPPERYRAPVQNRVLEPSCGDGRILDEVAARGSYGFGFECHTGRAAQARAKGHRVVTANFLEQVPVAEFDKVVMNPPFYGRHYAKHVRHAYKFLKPGGTLVAILPATARYDHGDLEGDWRDLPVASFAEAGTNVPTVLYRTKRPLA